MIRGSQIKSVDIRRKLRTICKNTKEKLTNDSRSSKAALTGVITLFVRCMVIGTGLISLPITARYLGPEQFGVWLLVSTFMNWISLADLGLTNSLVNTITTALATGDGKTARQSVSSAFFPMFFLGTFLLFSSICLSFFFPWDRIFNIRLLSSSAQDTRLAISVAMCFFAVRIPLSIPRCVYTAYQQGYIYQLWIGLSSPLSLLSLLFAQHYHANLPWLLGAFFGMGIIADLLAGIDLFYFRQRWLKPQLTNCSFKAFKSLLKVGFQFWMAQICAILLFQTDLIIVSQLFGVAEVGTYGVLLKLFSMLDLIPSSFTAALWPAYNDARARGDYKWIEKTFINSTIKNSIWSITTGSMLVFFSPTLVNYLTGQKLFFSPQVPLYMMLTYSLLSIDVCMSTLTNGLGELKVQSFVAPIAAITNLCLSLILGKMIGIQGVTLATAICILFFSIFLVGGSSMLLLKRELQIKS
jgi:O-antigen/teichoic acid export membrane protein